MGNIFGMSKGEFIGTASLLAIIILLAAFNLFYVWAPKPQADLSAFASQIAAFEEQQAAYADSVAAAKAERDSAFAARYQTYRNRPPRYVNRSYNRDDFHRHRLCADDKVEAGAFGLCSPEGLCGDLDLAQRILLYTIIHNGSN